MRSYLYLEMYCLLTSVQHHLPDSYICSGVRERSLEHAAHLEGIGVNLGDVVEHHQHSSQRVDAGEQADVTEQQELLQVVVKRSLWEGKEHPRYYGTKNTQLITTWRLNDGRGTVKTYQVRAHACLQSNLLLQRQLFVLQSSPPLQFVDHLLVASPLQPVRQKGLHELIQDLTGEQQRGQTLEEAGGIKKKNDQDTIHTLKGMEPEESEKTHTPV